MSTITEYFSKVIKEYDTELPSKAVMQEISVTLDHKMNVVIDKFLTNLQASKEHEARVKILTKADRCAGKYDKSKVIFEGINPYEQFSAIDTWLTNVKIAKTHTFFLFAPRADYIPASVKKIDDLEATTMHVVLGSTRGEKAAPEYKEWAETEPNETQEVFKKPLLALEVIRQPNFSFASLVKDEAYKNDVIDHSWRYGKMYACVEDKGQSKNTPKKLRSAGFNLCTLIHEKSSDDDLLAKEVVINSQVNYEDFSDEKELEDLDISVSVGELFKATRKAIVKKDEKDLEVCLENIFISSLGPVTTNSVKELVAATLEKNNKSD